MTQIIDLHTNTNNLNDSDSIGSYESKHAVSFKLPSLNFWGGYAERVVGALSWLPCSLLGGVSTYFAGNVSCTGWLHAKTVNNDGHSA